MNLQDVGQHEPLSAVVADVGALSVVRLSVHPHVPRRRKPLLTDLADVALLVGRFTPFSVGAHGGRRSSHQAWSPRARGVHHAHRPHPHPHPSRRGSRSRSRHFVRHRRAPRTRSAWASFSASRCRRCRRRWTGHHVWGDCRSHRVGVRRPAEGAPREMSTSPGRYSGRRRKRKRRSDAAHPRSDSRGRRRWRRLFPRSGGLAISGPTGLPGSRLPAVGSPPVRSRRSWRSSKSPRRRGHHTAAGNLLKCGRRQTPKGVRVGGHCPRRAVLSHLGIPGDIWRHPCPCPGAAALTDRKSSSVVNSGGRARRAGARPRSRWTHSVTVSVPYLVLRGPSPISRHRYGLSKGWHGVS